MPAGYDETLSYLETRYLTLDQLAAASGLTAPRIEALIWAGCLPAHSHTAVFSLRVEAEINGSHPTEDRVVRFYHRDLVALAVEADGLAAEQGLEAAARTLRARHDAAVAAGAELEAGSAAHVRFADDIWAAWRNGTFGVCLQRVATADMIQKVLATRQMQAMLEQASAEPIDVGALDTALARYAAVTGPFGPQERDGSTRARVYEPALALRQRLGAAT